MGAVVPGEDNLMRTRTLATFGIALVVVGLVVIGLILRQTHELGARSRPQPEAVVPAGPPATLAEVDTFLVRYNHDYRRLWTGSEGAKFLANSDITDEHTQQEVDAAQELADFVGDRQVIDQLRHLRRTPDLDDLHRRQLDRAWIEAAHYPGTAPATVSKLLATEAAATAAMYSHEYTLALSGKAARTVTPNQIDELLRTSRNLAERRAVWECSKSGGAALKDQLVELQGLRNTLARQMDYSSFFDLECADYGMTSDEMMTLIDDILASIMPLYQQLQCWVRYELAERYGVKVVPDMIPAHWLGNRWGQEWPGIVEGVDLDAMLRGRSPQWIVQQGERFYMSMGMPSLPLTFWGRSDLYELPPDATRKKNTHASAWHVDLDQDVRSLMSVRSDFSWFTTVHHELGHIYYYLAYSRPEVPYILRRGANRAFHEGIGTLIELASNEVPYLEEIGLLKPGEAPDQIRWLLNQALTGPVVFLPFACGTMTHWEHDFYENDMPRYWMNTRWWALAGQYQGIAPPSERGEDYCDPATKTHIIDDPAQYYDYALSEVILHQLHRYICRNILHQDVHAANYYGNHEVGDYLHAILAAGATRDWNQLLVEATGEPLNANALLDYFAPLQSWLQEQNKGRKVGW